MGAYAFRPMDPADLPRVRAWLAAPHVAAFWHDGDAFEFVSGTLDHPDMAQFIVTHAGEDLGYLQCYRLGAWHAAFEPQPQGTRGLDQFIGIAEKLGMGHGSAFVGAFARRLADAGVPRIVVDPRPYNPRAIRAYEKAGFLRDRELVTPDGPALLMVYPA